MLLNTPCSNRAAPCLLCSRIGGAIRRHASGTARQTLETGGGTGSITHPESVETTVRIDKWLLAVPGIPLAGAGFVLAQVVRAAHRSDLPSFPNQDPSGRFGDPGLQLLRIVAVGDSSITAPGVEHLDNTWIRRAAMSFADRHHVELICLAVGGSKAQDVIEGQLAEAVRLRPDIAVVSVGANDAIRGVAAGRYRRDLDYILTRLEDVSGSVVVYGMGDLGSIPRLPPALRPYLTYRSRVFNDMARRVVTAHPRSIKVWTQGRATSAFWEDESLFAADQFHAGDGGHAVFAEAAVPAVEAAYRMAIRRSARDVHGDRRAPQVPIRPSATLEAGTPGSSGQPS